MCIYIYLKSFFFFLNLDILVLPICIGIISIVFIHSAQKKSTSQKCLQNKTPMRRDPSSLNGGLLQHYEIEARTFAAPMAESETLNN